MQLVWFKRDLRTHDHEALASAAAAGPVLPLYIVEPGLWEQNDASGRHWAFLRETLLELRDDLARLGQPLIVRRGEAVEVLRQLVSHHPIRAVWSHQETGNALPSAHICVESLDRSQASYALSGRDGRLEMDLKEKIISIVNTGFVDFSILCIQFVL